MEEKRKDRKHRSPIYLQRARQTSSVGGGEGRGCVIGTGSGGTGHCEARGRSYGAVAGLQVLGDATVGAQLVAEGRAELRELLLRGGGGQEFSGGRTHATKTGLR